MFADPFAAFRAECAALIKSRVREPAGYIFAIPPKPEMGQLGCNVAFQLPRIRRNSPLRIAQEIAAGMDRSTFQLVGDVRVADPGFINFYLNLPIYAREVLDTISREGAGYGRRQDGEAERIPPPDVQDVPALQRDLHTAETRLAAIVPGTLYTLARGDTTLLTSTAEAALIGLLGRLPSVACADHATEDIEPLGQYAVSLITAINRFIEHYSTNSSASRSTLRAARLELAAAAAQVLHNLSDILQAGDV